MPGRRPRLNATGVVALGSVGKLSGQTRGNFRNYLKSSLSLRGRVRVGAYPWLLRNGGRAGNPLFDSEPNLLNTL